MLKPEDFFDLSKTRFRAIFDNAEYVWDALKNLKEYMRENIEPNVSELRRSKVVIGQTQILYQGEVIESGFEIEVSGKSPVVRINGSILDGASIIYEGAVLMDDEIYIGKGTIIEPGVLIKGPAIIGDYTELRQGAYLRGNTLVGDKCVVGHTTELKSCVMLGESKAGHFAYIGDSILGSVNLGAGTKLANLKIVQSNVLVNVNGKKYETGLRKFGAILGDGVETGCNSVTTPGTLLARGVLLYPNSTARGYYPPETIIKLKQKYEPEKRI
jgi:UDP-N-acetylglucosamine diphosphorylase / glucose-1-phosphate thymidylyltransferase / UDP-N-acetylgalactosamine diphosphorylase / glucosamine-1-phosphate N-acetyltransferase / galactosamine-1-phosphate N-acetyltransferase